MVASSDVDLDEIIKFGSLCSVMIPETFLSNKISTADVVTDNPMYHIDLVNVHDDKIVVVGSKSKTYRLNKVDTTLFYNDSSQAQMNGGTGVSVTNLVSLLHNINQKFKSCICMHNATSKETITPRAVGLIRVRALIKQGCIDVQFYYSHHFSTTLLSQVNVIEATGHPKQ